MCIMLSELLFKRCKILAFGVVQAFLFAVFLHNPRITKVSHRTFFGTVKEVLEINLVVILKPSATHSWLVCEDEGTLVVLSAYEVKSTKGFAKTHLGIP